MSQEHRSRPRKPKKHTDPRPKHTISSSTTFSPDERATKKKYWGLGCTAPAQVSVPAMIRTSANWEGKKVRRKKKNNNLVEEMEGNIPSDVWCGPGVGLSTDAADVDCVVSTRLVSGRGKVDIEKRGSYGGRRMVHPEDPPFFDTDSRTPHHRFDVFGSRHHRHLRDRFPEGLAEIVMLQGNLLMGGRLDHDRYRDWRLDVDSMSYEELLELGDKIGYVNTGLKEDEIRRCVRKTKSPLNNSSSHIRTDIQWKCTICQEEHEEGDEIGKLECGHFYHMYCIKQWLGQKKTCPICKAAVESQE